MFPLSGRILQYWTSFRRDIESHWVHRGRLETRHNYRPSALRSIDSKKHRRP